MAFAASAAAGAVGGEVMKKQIALMVILSTGIVLGASPSRGVAEEQVITNPPVVTPAIPPSE
jgi:hypothetical protein